MTAAETALAGTGVPPAHAVHANLTAPGLYEQALRRGEGRLSAEGAFMAITGVHTGRSVQDKFVVDDPEVHDRIWWGKVNQPMAPEKFRGLRERVAGWLGERPVLFTQDLYAGADPAHRVLNIGDSRPVGLMDMIRTLEGALGREAVKVMRPMQPGDVTATYADVSRLHALTGYRPETPIGPGIDAFVAWFRGHYGI